MRFAHYLVYENDNGLDKLNIVYIATGMPDINLLILNKLCILSISKCTVFCAKLHSFLCIMGQGIEGKGQGSGSRGQGIGNQKKYC